MRIKWLNRCEVLTERLRHTRHPGDYPEEEGKGGGKRGEEKEEEEEA